MEQDLTFLFGLVGMIDPPRPEVRAAIHTARCAGIKTIMITGDHKRTAMAIASDLHMFTPGLQGLTGEEDGQAGMTKPSTSWPWRWTSTPAYHRSTRCASWTPSNPWGKSWP